VKKTNIYIDADVDVALSRRAAAEGKTKAELIRWALRDAARFIHRWLREADQAAANPRKTLVRGSSQRTARNLARTGIKPFGRGHRGVELARGASGQQMPFMDALRAGNGRE
jgi:hypothetical protein